MPVPLTATDFDRLIARETARMSWPSRMGGIIRSKGKQKVEEGFQRIGIRMFPRMRNIRQQRKFNELHREMTKIIARSLSGCLHEGYQSPTTVARKLVNTFCHQLVKYPDFLHLRPFLHLPVDRQIITALTRVSRQVFERPMAEEVVEVLRNLSPYQMRWKKYEEFCRIANECRESLNRRHGAERQIEHVIDLNILWAM